MGKTLEGRQHEQRAFPYGSWSEDVPAEYAEEIGVGAKWAPLGFGETQQFDEGPAADLARIGALRTSVVHDIAGAILAELALTKIDHAMEVLGVLAVEEEIARRGAIEVAAYQVGVVTPQSVGVGELEKARDRSDA